MRIVILFLTIQIGLITSKSIYPNSCDDSHENKHKGLTKPEIIQHGGHTAHYYKINNPNNKLVEDNPSASKFVSNNGIHTGLQRNTVSETVINNNNNYRQASPYPIYYEKVDPKLIITSQLYNPNTNRRVNKNDDISNEEIEEAISIDLMDPNFNLSKITEEKKDLSKITNDRNEDSAKVEETNDPDFFNIRELREHLLDHLLDYFLNIFKDEQTNDTDKRDAKNHIRVEDKLSNYYNPHHIDLFIDEDEELDYEESVLNSPDYKGKSYKKKSNLKHQFYVSSENDTEYDNLLDVKENNTDYNILSNNNSQVNDTRKFDNLNFDSSNAESLHDLEEVKTAIEMNNDTVSLDNTEKYFIEDDDDDDEDDDDDVFQIHTNVVTTTEPTTIVNDVTTDVTVEETTQNQDIEEKYLIKDEQIDEYTYNEEIDEYQQNTNDEIINQNNEENHELNSDEDQEIPIKRNANVTNIEFDTMNNETLANINPNNSIHLVVHLDNVDSSEINGKEPVNTTQILTLLKKIKEDYKTGNHTKHMNHKHRSNSKGHHCKKSILLNLNINVD